VHPVGQLLIFIVLAFLSIFFVHFTTLLEKSNIFSDLEFLIDLPSSGFQDLLSGVSLVFSEDEHFDVLLNVRTFFFNFGLEGGEFHQAEDKVVMREVDGLVDVMNRVYDQLLVPVCAGLPVDLVHGHVFSLQSLAADFSTSIVVFGVESVVDVPGDSTHQLEVFTVESSVHFLGELASGVLH